MKQTLVGLALAGSSFLSPLVILEVKRDSRAFDVDGQTVFVSQNRNREGELEMYTGSGFVGTRSFDADNDGELDFSQDECGTPSRCPIIIRTEATAARQELYKDVRQQYLSGKGKVTGFVGIFNSIKDSIGYLFK